MLSHITLLFLLGLSLCNAHHMITNIYIGDVDQGDGTCVRVPPNTNPVTDVKSNDMACNVGGEKSLDRFCVFDAGQVIKLVWKTWPDGTVTTPIDASHEGWFLFLATRWWALVAGVDVAKALARFI